MFLLHIIKNVMEVNKMEVIMGKNVRKCVVCGEPAKYVKADTYEYRCEFHKL